MWQLLGFLSEHDPKMQRFPHVLVYLQEGSAPGRQDHRFQSGPAVLANYATAELSV